MKERKGCKRGCLGGCLTVVILVLLLGGAGVWLVRNQFHTVMDRFERAGYSTVIVDDVMQDSLVIKDKVKEPTIFVARHVKVLNGSTRGISFLCETAEIQGTVEGNVHFIGRELTVGETALLKLDLEAKTMILNQFGIIEGELTGYQGTINKTPPPSDNVTLTQP